MIFLVARSGSKGTSNILRAERLAMSSSDEMARARQVRAAAGKQRATDTNDRGPISEWGGLFGGCCLLCLCVGFGQQTLFPNPQTRLSYIITLR